MNRRRTVVIRNRYFAVSDLLLTALSAILGFAVRLDVPLFGEYLPVCLSFVVLSIVIKLPVYYFFGLYRCYWRYAGGKELLRLVGATATGSAILAVLVLTVFLPLGWFERFPRSVLIIDWLWSLLFIAGTRFLVRFMGESGALRYKNGSSRRESESRRVLIMGAGDAGAMIVREMLANPGQGYMPVGLLDDNSAKVGMTIYGVPVQGTREDIPDLVRELQIDEVLIAMPTVPGTTIREIVAICHSAGVVPKTMPGIYELISGQISVNQVREICIEDLLRRTPVRINGDGAGQLLSGSTVLVTGAGGSIGSELCRQVARRGPKKLLLLGHGENSIHGIQLQLQDLFPHLAVESLIADVRDYDRLNEIMKEHQPDIVFHTAAHKHVPLMEENVSEAVYNNIFGTLSLLRVAEANDVARFVLVSTDKAVNPSNVMGATKRVAELLVQDSARRTGHSYVAVRFGNVLGSRGSVVPLFQRQIAAQGPVTVTHPEMKRFFMTIPEAVQLIIQAALVGEGGEILVLDMGEPVPIVDLATELIRLSGLEPGRDISIVFTGSRPGEKLDEELFGDGEEPRPTRFPEILVARGNNTWDPAALSCHLDELEALTKEGNAQQIRAKMKEIVPEYRSLTS